MADRNRDHLNRDDLNPDAGNPQSHVSPRPARVRRSPTHPKPRPTHSVKRNARSREVSWTRQLRYFYVRFVRMRGSSKAIARGLAAGVFAGWFPLFGLQTIIGIALAAILEGNKIMAAAGTWVSNPFTYVPIYYFNFRMGQWLLGLVGFEGEMLDMELLSDVVTASGWDSFSEFLGLGFNFVFTLFLGCFVTGLISAVLAYFLGLWLIQRIRQRRRRI